MTVSSSAFAGSVSGINLSWDDCGSFGAADRTILCTTNSGASILVGSLVASAGLDSVVGMASVIDLTTATDPLPLWWNMQPGGCRPTSTSAAFSFGVLGSCIDQWNGQALGGYSYEIGGFSTSATASPTNHARIRTVCAQPASSTQPMVAGTEYYMFEVVINNAKTVGAGSCAGCLTPVCLRLNVIETYQPPSQGADKFFTDPPAGGSATVTFQGGAGVNCASVPIRNRTWGQVKSLYR
jgi:hypothetical protein